MQHVTNLVARGSLSSIRRDPTTREQRCEGSSQYSSGE